MITSELNNNVLFPLWLQVDDISAAIADLKTKNIRMLSAEPRIGAHGKPVMFLHPKDCDGVLVELEEAWSIASCRWLRGAINVFSRQFDDQSDNGDCSL